MAFLKSTFYSLLIPLPILMFVVPILILMESNDITWLFAVRFAFSSFHPLALALQFYLMFAVILLSEFACEQPTASRVWESQRLLGRWKP